MKTYAPNQIVVALDGNMEDGMSLIRQIEDNSDIEYMIYGYKVGSLWILERGLEAVENVYGILNDHVVILDMQKWPTDIPDIVTRQINIIANTCAVDEMVACPMGSGMKSLEAFVTSCKDGNIRPLCVLEMTHPESDSYLSESSYMKILNDAATLGIDGYIIPATKTPKLEIKTFLNKNFLDLNEEFYATGFKAQQGQVEPMIDFGVKKYIVGRGIYESRDPIKAIKDIYSHINKISVTT